MSRVPAKQTNKQTLLKHCTSLESCSNSLHLHPLSTPASHGQRGFSRYGGPGHCWSCELGLLSAIDAFTSDYWCDFTQWFSIRGDFVLQGIFVHVWKWLGTLLNVPECTGQPPATKGYSIQNASAADGIGRGSWGRSYMHTHSWFISLTEESNTTS